MFFNLSSFSGSTLLELIKSAINNIGIKDVRKIDTAAGSESLMDKIQAFHTAALEFDLNENGLRRQFVIRSITRNHQKVTQLLNKPWNVDLSQTAAADNTSGRSITFRLATPLKQREIYSCSDCGKVFSNWKIFKGHVKKKHDKIVDGEGPKVTCLLPHKRGTRVTDRHPMDQICSHLFSYHGIPKPSKNHNFRGHKSKDGGENWEPVFLLSSEPDPISTHSSSQKPSGEPSSAVKTLDFESTKETVTATAYKVAQDKNGEEDDKQTDEGKEPEDQEVSKGVAEASPIQSSKSELEKIDDQQTEKKDKSEDRVQLLTEPEPEKNSLNAEPEKSSASECPILWEIDDEICSSFEDRLKNADEAVGDEAIEVEDDDSDVDDSWIDSIAGQDGRQNAIRRKEMTKSYKRLILFVLKQLGRVDFGTDLMSLLRRDKIRSNLKEVGEEINASKSWNKLQTLIDQEHREMKKAKQKVNPDEVHNAAQGNRTYFSSPEFRSRLEKNHKIWDDALATNKIGPQNFDNVGQFARHLLCMTDRNRQAGYWFKNSHFDARRQIWFPPGHNKEKFDGIPENFNMFSRPEDGREPDAWMIDLSGCEEILKMGQDVNIIVLRMAHDWLIKYRDLKQIKWSNIKLDEFFFVNHRRKKYGPLVNTAQLKEYGTVTGTTKVTTNSFRRAMEPAIQSDQALKTRSKDISSHSESTGAKYYDASAPQFRAAAVHFLNDGEIDYASQSVPDDVPDAVAAKRIKLDQEGQKSSLDRAKMKISKDKAKRNVTLGKNCKVAPSHRVFMQESFSKDGIYSGFGLFNDRFPGIYCIPVLLEHIK